MHVLLTLPPSPKAKVISFFVFWRLQKNKTIGTKRKKRCDKVIAVQATWPARKQRDLCESCTPHNKGTCVLFYVWRSKSETKDGILSSSGLESRHSIGSNENGMWKADSKLCAHNCCKRTKIFQTVVSVKSSQTFNVLQLCINMYSHFWQCIGEAFSFLVRISQHRH